MTDLNWKHPKAIKERGFYWWTSWHHDIQIDWIEPTNEDLDHLFGMNADDAPIVMGPIPIPNFPSMKEHLNIWTRS